MDPFASIRCQTAAVATLRHAASSGRVASAYLFEGASGVGKQQTALAFAEAVINTDHNASVARRIQEGKHPDVRVFEVREEGHQNMRVETVREDVLPFAEFAPFEANAAFLIFPEAHLSFPERHPESANALLKTLEEPKRGVTFILLAAHVDRLLPTIRSRCQSVRFKRLGIDELVAIAFDHGFSQEIALTAAGLSGGRADRMLELCQDDAANTLFELALSVHDATSSKRPGRLLDAAEALCAQEHLSIALDGLVLFYRDLARLDLGHTDDTLVFRHQAKALHQRVKHVDAGMAATRAARIQEVGRALEANGNKQVVMDALLYQLGTG